jgi:hypothetical protein
MRSEDKGRVPRVGVKYHLEWPRSAVRVARRTHSHHRRGVDVHGHRKRDERDRASGYVRRRFRVRFRSPRRANARVGHRCASTTRAPARACARLGSPRATTSAPRSHPIGHRLCPNSDDGHETFCNFALDGAWILPKVRIPRRRRRLRPSHRPERPSSVQSKVFRGNPIAVIERRYIVVVIR